MKFEEAIKEAERMSRESGKKYTLSYEDMKTNFAVKSYSENDDVFILTNTGEQLKDGLCLLTFEELSGDKWSVGQPVNPNNEKAGNK